MTQKFKAVEPEVIPLSKPKIIVSGKAGVGKTFGAIDWPKCYFIDTEGGATLPHYTEKLQKAGAVYFGKEQGSQDFKVVIAEIKALATTPHEYKTLVIDSFSKLYNIARSEAEETGGSDFGRDKKEANKPTRQMMLWLERVDMNVILICHATDKWSRVGKDVVYAGTTFDGDPKQEYSLDLWLEIILEAGKRSAIVRKSRYQTFPQDSVFEWTYKSFASRIEGGEKFLEKKAATVDLITPEQLTSIKRLLEIVKIEDNWEDKVIAKAGVTEWTEMPRELAQKCLDFLSKKLEK